MRMKVGVPRGRCQNPWLNLHMNPHLWLIDIMRSTRMFILSLTSDVTEIIHSTFW
ncbi:hypothetical protein L798_08998 [Zootermopsis nevadensis]|uniref:Uncharacterized protein n=1 Tax=Zootermopsis nevadensis TaxID=136037 RepID=A0A067RMD9_ZOONE|nr:hypothetical protein L798_08998 [Zootermopsis nevadensis]